ncbi:GTP-binding protein Era [Dongia mobilis]|uniref:GTPase Era n=1 Tax=Dongia mobilis TaxID=578943 RepID=A0A4R6WRR9_9PROT|nr:GTPase Era [Dongia mobilis]TDQ82536.1 GTP-binding protein Era [Dongia mobilis]
MEQRCGFIAVLGAPNAGKSTLVNRVVGQKVSIVSPKVQTTRARVIGIVMQGPTQMVFVDTPGIFAPKRRLDRAMVAAAWSGAGDADAVVLLVDAARKGIDDDTRRIIEGLRAHNRQAILVLNKVDLVKERERLLAKTAELNALGANESGGGDRPLFSDTFMISAETGDGVADLVDELARRMPPGPHHFPEDHITDAPQRFLAAEVTREHLFRQLHEEVPYQLTVETEAWEEFKDGSVKITQVIFLAKENQKPIVIGKGGQKIKQIRESAQRELQAMLERPVHLFLFVKVRTGWADDPERYREMGLDFEE